MIKKSQILLGEKTGMKPVQLEKYYQEVSKATDTKNPQEVELKFFEMYKKDNDLERFLTPKHVGKKVVYTLNLKGFIRYIKEM